MADDGQACCILGVCCADAMAQRLALVARLEQSCGCDAVTAGTVADWFLTHFDLVPKGMIKPLMMHVTALVRKHDATGA